MKRLAVIVSAMLIAIMTAIPAFAYYRNYYMGCNSLMVVIDTHDRGKWMIHKSAATCAHGKVNGAVQNKEIELTNIGLFGPDCQVIFYDLNNNNVMSTYRFQQNYCSTHSGNITVQHIKGPKISYRVFEGAWSSEKSGQVVMDPR